MSKLTFTIYGGAGTVTGSNFLLADEEKGFRILVDCGLEQGGTSAAAQHNQADFVYDPKGINVLLVTHAHIDHIGRIPKLVHAGFRGPIISTVATKELAALMFADALGIMHYNAAKAERRGDKQAAKEIVLYEKEDAEQALSQWHTVSYHEDHDVGGGFKIYLRDAGHILGSSTIEITYKGSSIVFTGDLGNSPSPLLRDTEIVPTARYVVMESVYGSRNHPPHEGRSERLRDIVEKAIARGGTLVIPAFSNERTQTLLFELNNIIEANEIPSVPVFLDSPLAISVTNVYRRHTDLFNEAAQDQMRAGDDLFKFPRLRITETVEESKEINEVPGPKIILAGSGMSMGGRVIHHERRYLGDPKSTILLVGYQVPGSLGRKLEEGVKKVEIFGESMPVRATIESLAGYSAHKGSDELFAWAAAAKQAEEFFVVLGEPKSGLFLTQRIRDYLAKPAVYPKPGQQFTLEF
jgi:metallo-beta-lactamase family protein